MDRLKQANLYRNELISVSGKLVERYNKCLLKLGLTTSKLTTFSIDGIGWSPEIAEEKKDTNYLNNGEANPNGIIITPLQKGIAIYNPFHSFDKEMMKAVFKKHGNKITDITRDSAICVEFDQNIDVFYEPLDVLKYKDIIIKFHLIDNLDKAKAAQLKLVEEFNKDNNFIDEDLHQKLLVSAKKHGDLRERDLELEDILFTTDSFYTKAFGGIYILRDFIEPILIFENETTYKEAIKDTIYEVLMYHISHIELIDKLKKHLIIECDLKEEVQSKRYDRIKKFTFSTYLKETNHPIKNILQDQILFKSYLNKIAISDRKKVMGLEIYLEKKKISKNIKVQDIVDQEIYFALHKPHSSLKANHQDLIWNLLVNVVSIDVLFLYWYDKEDFYQQYKKLDDSMKDWVIDTICNNF
ncbi:hypothetical protein MC378_01125 [Polaribacter sp. MSW13]|uniref:Uncharacterized protein n=1 Tax=Polaribacter marinus TaxID=2916838 RepID=A0A9X1VKN6_9FLAO|nr:DUF6638 family protein [Polaribacter marinus]MCI2227748.1 hypothetical protein [Polaribacter marinus]